MTHVRSECHNCEVCQHPVYPRDGVCVQQHYYHYNCFRCTCCGETLKMRKYEIANGKPYCLEDFLQLFAEQLGICATPSVMHVKKITRNRMFELPAAATPPSDSDFCSSPCVSQSESTLENTSG
ncbi:hypothetical protein PHET_01481 [Paragonimus heterotremus]|uniref:LIM zinc-binding domain-containing protein n=1 Tax=Paragonimus heterotremus TaxID=100268 RepID=A0A8J4STX3_9TREM|nr:hypothetical protein PHET_01481 [Paragonimus heterotremus]